MRRSSLGVQSVVSGCCSEPSHLRKSIIHPTVRVFTFLFLFFLAGRAPQVHKHCQLVRTRYDAFIGLFIPGRNSKGWSRVSARRKTFFSKSQCLGLRYSDPHVWGGAQTIWCHPFRVVAPNLLVGRPKPTFGDFCRWIPCVSTQQ